LGEISQRAERKNGKKQKKRRSSSANPTKGFFLGGGGGVISRNALYFKDFEGKKKSKVDIFRQSASGHRLTFTEGFEKDSTFLCVAKF
jgi:hypothetical protein